MRIFAETRHVRLGAGAVALSALLLGACGSSGSGPLGSESGADGGAGMGATAADIAGTCTAWAKARCEKIKTCYDTVGAGDFRIQRDYGDLATCEERIRQTCSEGLARKDTGNSVARQTKCTTALAQQSCPDWLAGIDLPADACPEVTGPRAAGAPCVSSDQCQTRYCSVRADQGCGVCAAKVGAGVACEVNADCTVGLTCQTDPDTTASACAATPVKGAAGAACNAMLTCGAGLQCVGANKKMMTDGSCQPLVAMEGAACDPQRVTAADCDPAVGLYCNALAKTCQKRLVAAPGQPCADLPDGTVANCAGGASCVRPLDPATMKRPAAGTCVADSPAGMSCAKAAADGPGCAAGLRCVLDGPTATAGTCKARDDGACTM